MRTVSCAPGSTLKSALKALRSPAAASSSVGLGRLAPLLCNEPAEQTLGQAGGGRDVPAESVGSFPEA